MIRNVRILAICLALVICTCATVFAAEPPAGVPVLKFDRVQDVSKMPANFRTCKSMYKRMKGDQYPTREGLEGLRDSGSSFMSAMASPARTIVSRGAVSTYTSFRCTLSGKERRNLPMPISMPVDLRTASLAMDMARSCTGGMYISTGRHNTTITSHISVLSVIRSHRGRMACRFRGFGTSG